MLQALRTLSRITKRAAAIAAAVLAFGGAAGVATEVQAQEAGRSICTAPAQNGYCVDSVTWRAKPGDRIATFVGFKGIVPAIYGGTSSLSGLQFGGVMYGAEPLPLIWNVPAGTAPGTYIGVLNIGCDPSTYNTNFCPAPGQGVFTLIVESDTPPPPQTASYTNLPVAHNGEYGFEPWMSGVVTEIQIVSAPSNGRMDRVSPTAFFYRPNTGYSGQDSVIYRAVGPGGASANHSASFVVAAPPLPPPPSTESYVRSTAYNNPFGFHPSITGNATSLQIVGGPTNSTISWIHTYAFTVTPTPGFIGQEVISYQAVGPGGRSAVHTLTLNVQPPAAPTADAASLSTAYQTPRSIALPVGGVVSSASIVSGPSNGTASISGTTLTYTPAAGFHGADQLFYRADGPGGSSPSRSVAITVAPPPAPTVQGGSISTAYQTAGAVTLSVGGVSPTLELATGPSSGSVSFSGARVTYTPAAGFYGADSFTVRARNAGGVSAPATVSVTVAAPPAPTVQGGSIATAYGSPGAVTLSVGGVSPTLELATGPSSGSVAFSGARVTYTPAAGFYGADSFTVRARNAGGVSAPATVSVTVAAPPAPTATNASLNTAFQTAGSVVLPVAGVIDGVQIVAQPVNGTASIDGSRLTYVPSTAFHGSDVVTFRAVGPGGNSPTRTVTVTVAPPAGPTVQSGVIATAYETAGSVTLTVGGFAPVLELVNEPASGSVAINDRTVTYTPRNRFIGEDEFTIRAVNDGGASAPAAVRVTVAAPAAPSLPDAEISTAFGAEGEVSLAPGGVFDAVRLVAGPSHGSAEVTGLVARYTPNDGFFGSDSFSVEAEGPGGVSSPATVAVTVGLPAAPVAQAQAVAVGFGQPERITLGATGVVTDFEIVGQPANGSAALSGAEATYTPAAGFYGADSFTFRAVGPGGQSADATVTLNVGVPTAPSAADTTLAVQYETAGTVTLPISGVVDNVTVEQGRHGQVAVDGRAASYTPQAGFYGTDSFAYRARGPGGDSNSATVTVTVGLPAAPSVSDTTLSTEFQTSGAVILPAQGVLTSVNVVDAPRHGTTSINGTTLTFTPAPGFHGTDELTFSATGPGGVSNVATLQILVGLPSAPTLSNLAMATGYEEAVSGSLTVSGFNPSIVKIEDPQNGTAEIAGTGITYTPARGFFGQDTFTVLARNAGGDSAPATVTINVGLPPAPGLQPGVLTTEFEQVGRLDLVTSGVVSSLELVTLPSRGSAVLADRTISYTPEAGFYGEDELTVRAVGPGGASAPITVSIVVGLPGAPSIQAASLATPFETIGDVELRVSGVRDLVEIVTQGRHGVGVLEGETLRYTPNAGYYGGDAVVVRAIGPGGTSAPATVAVQVGLPSAPVAQAVELATAFGASGAAELVATGVYERFALVAPPAHGRVDLDGSRATYMPDEGFFGADSFSYRAIGPGGNSAPATVSVAVGLPAAPTARAGALETPFETVGTIVLTGAGVRDGFAIAAQPSNGAVILAGDEARYTPAPGFFGDDEFTFIATGPGGVSAPATVTVRVGLPGRPVASPSSIQVAYETGGSATLRATGIFDDFVVTTEPANGRVSVEGSVASYTPDPLFYGADAFAYVARGPGGVSNPAVVAVNVGLPGAPAVAGSAITTTYETPSETTLTVSGVYSRLELVGDPSHGRATLQDNVLRYQPDAGFYGSDAVGVRAIGPGGNSPTTTISVSVERPAAPTVAAAEISTAFETAREIELSVTGLLDTIEIETAPAHGEAVIQGQRLRYNPEGGFFGEDALTVRAIGPGGHSAPVVVSIRVGNPAAPFADDAELRTAFGTPGSVTLAVSGLVSTVAIQAAAEHGEAILQGAVVNYTPREGFFGVDRVLVRITGPGGEHTARVSITVGNPAAPLIAEAELATAFETPGTVELSVSGLYSTLDVQNQPANGVATLQGEVLTYTPAAGFHGEDVVMVRVTGPGGEATARVLVTVGRPDAPSVDAGDLLLTTPFETPVSADLTGEGVVDRFSVQSVPAHGNAEVSGSRLTYTPSAGFFGVDRMTYVAVGPGGQSQERAVIITVGVPAPAVNDIAIVTQMDVAASADLAADVEHVSSAELVALPASGSVAIVGTVATYTPSEGFFGADRFTFTLSGPGGTSEVATATVTVEGGPAPEAEGMEKSGLSGDPIRFNVAAELAGGPFSAVRVTDAAEIGRVEVQGLSLVFYPPVDWTGRTSFGFAVENRFGWSAPAIATAIVHPRPATGPVIDAETWAGQPVDIGLTESATGGPFLSADVVGVSVQGAVELAIKKSGTGYVLTATPQGQFVGRVDIRFTLRNAFAVSEVGLVRLTVKDRPDPSRDPEVTGLVNAQTQAAYRFGFAQTNNVLRRLEQLHDGGPVRNSLNLSLVPMNEDDRPWENEAQRQQRQFREQGNRAGGGAPAFGGSSTQSEAGPVGYWASGVIDLGFNRRDELREGIEFTTDGITVGADTRVSEKLAVGAGVGFGHDQSKVGLRGTSTSANAYSAFVYGSWLPRQKLFVDGVLGYSLMDFEAVRLVTETGGFMPSSRRGHQWFGSIAAGYEGQTPNLRWSPYGRVEFSEVTLRSFREHGDDMWALAFAQQSSAQVRAAFGVHGEYLLQYRSGALKPTFRAEYLHDLANGGTAGVRYADWAASPLYRLELAPYDDRNVRLGLGLLWQGLDGVSVGVGYEGTVMNRTSQSGRLRLDFSVQY